MTLFDHFAILSPLAPMKATSCLLCKGDHPNALMSHNDVVYLAWITYRDQGIPFT